ncbi:DUF2642 domain-containing protein [Paenibacillus solisilvae]|uniref:DUF2642 domain-containing protein n=1 Tax=Paenibacillus solisilvae TaxID=2486751 RepID=A0ABW0VYC4_9BACL
MNEFQPFIGKRIMVEVSGKRPLPGKLIDIGPDILVLVHQQRFLYIPIAHVHNLKADLLSDEDIGQTDDLLVQPQIEQISVPRMLREAKGIFVEIQVSGNKPLRGYLIGIMTDYIVIHSPVYKSIYVSLRHMKWLIPYPPSYVPYSLSADPLPAQHASLALSKTFETQCKKEEGKMVVLDLGEQHEKIGLIKRVSSGIMDFLDADGNSNLLNIEHLKTMYTPSK